LQASNKVLRKFFQLPMRQTRQGEVSVPQINIEFEQEADGRWIADISAMPGVMAYGKTRGEAALAVKILALRVIASKMEESRSNPGCKKLDISIACA
jgi:predicted RNase H-like HicB family nuclease